MHLTLREVGPNERVRLTKTNRWGVVTGKISGGMQFEVRFDDGTTARLPGNTGVEWDEEHDEKHGT